jgi:hypothetical protein
MVAYFVTLVTNKYLPENSPEIKLVVCRKNILLLAVKWERNYRILRKQVQHCHAALTFSLMMDRGFNMYKGSNKIQRYHLPEKNGFLKAGVFEYSKPGFSDKNFGTMNLKSP